MTTVALFDFCGTVVPFQTADLFVEFVQEVLPDSRRAWLAELQRLIGRTGSLLPASVLRKWALTKRLQLMHLRGLTRRQLEGLGEEYYRSRLRPFLSRQTIAEIRRRQVAGDRVIIVTGAYAEFVTPFAADFGINEVIATRIAFGRNGVCTGRFEGADCVEQQKVLRLFDALANADVNWQASSAYSDSVMDLPMLRQVGNPIVVSLRGPQQWATDFGFREIVDRC